MIVGSLPLSLGWAGEAVAPRQAIKIRQRGIAAVKISRSVSGRSAVSSAVFVRFAPGLGPERTLN